MKKRVKKDFCVAAVSLLINCVVVFSNLGFIDASRIHHNKIYVDRSNNNYIKNNNIGASYRSSKFRKLIERITFLEESTVNSNYLSVAPPEKKQKTSKPLAPSFYEWLWNINNVAIGNIDLSWMDGEDSKCVDFCSCVAGELIQRMIKDRTQRRLQIGVDDLAQPEEYILKPLCLVGGQEVIIRKWEGLWQWQRAPAVEDKFGEQCWTGSESLKADCISKSLINITDPKTGKAGKEDVFKPIRDQGTLTGSVAIIINMLNKYNPERIFTENGNPDLTVEGEEVQVGDFLINSKFKREYCLNKHMVTEAKTEKDPPPKPKDDKKPKGDKKPKEKCCKKCARGIACGDTCISRDKKCSKPKGCACNAKLLLLETWEQAKIRNQESGPSEEIKDRCRCTKSLCMQDIIKTVSEYYKLMINSLHEFGESDPKCLNSGFNMLDTHLDVLGLIPPMQSFKFDILKMLVNINHGHNISSKDSPPKPKDDKKPKEKCCKECATGIACGDTCISRDKKCSKPKGCACNAKLLLLETWVKTKMSRPQSKARSKKDKKKDGSEPSPGRTSAMKTPEGIGKDGDKYYESGIIDFITSIPLFGWSGPYLKVMGKVAGTRFNDGALLILLDATRKVIHGVPPESKGNMGSELMKIEKALEPALINFGNAITHSNWESNQWLDRVANETMQDESTKEKEINKIANTMFELIVRFGCSDFKFLKENNKKINGALPSIEIDGANKEGTFIQKMYLHLIQVVGEVLEYVHHDRFTALKMLIDSGLEKCLERCYNSMENKTTHGGDSNNPGKFGKSEEMDRVQICITKAAETFSGCSAKQEAEAGDKGGGNDAQGSSDNSVDDQQQQANDSGGNSNEAPLATMDSDSTTRPATRSQTNAQPEQQQMFLQIVEDGKSAACSFSPPGDKDDQNFVDRPWKVIKKLHERTKWEDDHYSCQLSEQPLVLINPREFMKNKETKKLKKKKSCDGVCPKKKKDGFFKRLAKRVGNAIKGSEAGDSLRDGANQAQSQLQQQEGESATEQQQAMAMLQYKSISRRHSSARRSNYELTLIEISERIRCGCNDAITNGFDLPKAKMGFSQSQLNPLGTTPKATNLDDNMPSGEDIASQANERNNFNDQFGQNLLNNPNQQSSMLMAN
jgi:hypothetical protein